MRLGFINLKNGYMSRKMLQREYPGYTTLSILSVWLYQYAGSIMKTDPLTFDGTVTHRDRGSSAFKEMF
jgi:hypothetical protein